MDSIKPYDILMGDYNGDMWSPNPTRPWQRTFSGCKNLHSDKCAEQGRYRSRDGYCFAVPQSQAPSHCSLKLFFGTTTKSPSGNGPQFCFLFSMPRPCQDLVTAKLSKRSERAMSTPTLCAFVNCPTLCDTDCDFPCTTLAITSGALSQSCRWRHSGFPSLRCLLPAPGRGCLLPWTSSCRQARLADGVSGRPHQ